MPNGENYKIPKEVDGFMFAVLLEAMMIGETLYIHGPVSSFALKNAALFCEAWHNLMPEIYTYINIVPDSIVMDNDADKHINDNAISAFSGGIDGIFTALRHSQKDLGYGSHNLTHILMVHGLDVTPENLTGFELLQKRVSPIYESLGLSNINIWTDFRQLTRQNWEMGFSAQLAACLHLMSGTFKYGLIASSEPYRDMVLPWGSNPATDYLLSGGAMDIVHDGAGYTRTEKIKRIAKNEISKRLAKFCWQGEPDKNCGFCEKCIRTRFNFLAAVNEHNPGCFDQPFDLSVVDKLELRNKAVYTEFKSILQYVENENRTDDWVDSLRALVKRHENLYDNRPTLKEGEVNVCHNKTAGGILKRLFR